MRPKKAKYCLSHHQLQQLKFLFQALEMLNIWSSVATQRGEILPITSSQKSIQLARLGALKNSKWNTFNKSTIPDFKILRNPILTQRAPSFPTPNPDVRTRQNYDTCQLQGSSKRAAERPMLKQTQENRKRKDRLITKATE